MTSWLRRVDELAARAGLVEAAPSGPTAAELPPLRRIGDLFGLGLAERDALLIAMSVEVDDTYATIFEGRPRAGTVARSTGGALELFAPGSRLHRHGLLDVLGDGPLATRAVRVPPSLWPRLIGWPAAPPFPVLPPRRDALAELELTAATHETVDAALRWARFLAGPTFALRIGGDDGAGRDALAAAIAHELGYAAIVIEGTSLDDGDLMRDLAREAISATAAVLIREPVATAAAAALCGYPDVPVILIGSTAPAGLDLGRPTLEVELAAPDIDARAAIWRRMLGDHASATVDPDWLAARYRFGPGRIAAAIATARARAVARGAARLDPSDLEKACRPAGSTGAGRLARRLDCPYAIEDLVLPATTRRELDLIAAWARHGHRVLRGATTALRGAGVEALVCLFAGPPGTGKTMAAQVMARALSLDLLRIDLSQVVNKYIGETEKNLDRVFAEADASGAVLFFDEADALFGKRTEVRDAHDRYANVETAFLLQRLESHHGLTILASNLKQNLDAAFLRRFQIVAEFPAPGPDERRAIWERHVIRDRMDRDADLATLAGRFAITGGDIRNAAITAALLAAQEGSPIGMCHLVLGVWRELQKSGRLSSDFGPWQDLVVEYARTGRVR